MPPAPQPTSSFNEALLRFGGMYGSAWRNGVQLAEVVEVTGATEVNRIDVPLVGTTKTGYKPGRETREGTLRIQKIDTKWELEIFAFLNQSLADRRAARDAGAGGAIRPFSMILQYDDPDALAKEEWQLDGVIIWRMPLGYSITDDIVEREFPITWEVETPLNTFTKDVGAGGVAIAKPVHSTTQVTGQE